MDTAALPTFFLNLAVAVRTADEEGARLAWFLAKESWAAVATLSNGRQVSCEMEQMLLNTTQAGWAFQGVCEAWRARGLPEWVGQAA